ncbi:TorF family putative porin, partial [Vibrio parahaemolyticus]
ATVAQAEEDKPVWKAPFGGTFTAGAAFITDYSYRGISQTQRQVAFQPTLTYETPTVSEKVTLSAYVGAWASNVYFPGTNAAAEIDLIAGFR